MAALTGRKPKDTYKDLLQVSQSNTGITAALTAVSDGEGTTSPLQISQTQVNIAGAGALLINGVSLTATAAQLNSLASVDFSRFSSGILIGPIEKIQSWSGSGTVNIGSPSLGHINLITMTGDTTCVLPSSPLPATPSDVASVTIIVRVYMQSYGALSFSGNIYWNNSASMPFHPGAGKYAIYAFTFFRNESYWFGSRIWRNA